jgi:predicted MFS family arabinose efflux permease
VVAAIALFAFIQLERHQRAPMLDLSLFRSRTYAGANIAMLLVALAMFGVFFFVSLYMQNVLGYSPVKTGAAFLPMTVLIILVAPIAGKYSDHVGSRWLVGVGMVLLSFSLLIFSRLEATSNFWDILPGLLVGGLGMAIVMTPITAAAMGSVPVDKAGVGSAVLNSGRQVGGSLGIAVMGAIVAASATGVPGTPEALQGFVTGYQHALQVAAAIALAGAVLSVATIRKYRHAETPVPEAA